MKKVWVFLCLSCALIACEQLPEDYEGSRQIVFNLTVNHPEATKAIKTGWETGDVIYVFFSGKAAPAFLEMKWNGSGWNNTPNNGLSFQNGEKGNMRAIYLPFGNSVNVLADGNSFTFSKLFSSYYMTDIISYSVVENKIDGVFSMAIPEGFVQFFLDNEDAQEDDVIELRESHIRARKLTSVSADGSLTESLSAWGAPLPGYNYDKEVKNANDKNGYLFSGELESSSRGVKVDYLFTCVAGDIKREYYTKLFSDKTLYKTESSGRAIKLPEISSWNKTTTHTPIDLGTEINGKRIYWSRVNLGATDEGDFGDYYAWGETAKKTNFVWATYTLADGSAKSLIKYNNNSAYGVVDNKTILEAEDDVVTTKLNGHRRIPTKAEWESLIENCTWTWKTKEDGYTNCGYLISGKNEYSGNHIFLPATGAKSGTGFEPELSPEDGFGCYWTSNLDTSIPSQAWRLGISETGITLYSYYRSSGLTIRPVIE